MAPHTLLTIIFAITLNANVLSMHWYSNHDISVIFALFDNKFIRQFQTTLTNDLHANCTEQMDIDVNTTLTNTKECVRNEISRLRTKEKKPYDGQYVQEIPRKEMCKDETIQKCFDKFATAIKPCLSMEAEKSLTQIGQIINASIDSLLCTNDGEKVKIIFDKWANCSYEIRNCEDYINIDGIDHLRDFFTTQRCSKYEKFIDCKVSTFNLCPEIAHIYDIMLNNLYQVSPCY